MIRSRINNKTVILCQDWKHENLPCDRCSKFCEYCGKERVVVLDNTFDPDTGHQEAYRECRNPQCGGVSWSPTGYGGGAHNLRSDNCRKTGGHNMKRSWDLFFPNGKHCTKCDYIESNYTGYY